MHASLIWAVTDDDDGERMKHGKVSSSPPASLIKFLKSATFAGAKASELNWDESVFKLQQSDPELLPVACSSAALYGPRGHVTQPCERRSGEEDEADEEKEDEEV